MTHRIWFMMVILAAGAGGSFATPQKSDPSIGAGPALAHTCLITGDVKRLVDFYELILNLKAKWSGPDYAEFRTAAGVLAIFSSEAQEKYIPGSAEAAKNRSMILEFEVADVDGQYRRLGNLVKVWVKPPTTQPWGTRSIYFRDPDGNLVDFYKPVKAR
ncbi:MAG: VOC family protein [Terracidiphilus sp.]|jgi:catechol 2,3-dioxygenase-like lactoylglutathione lyase family enzyme